MSSIKETFGVGTLIATPSNFPFKDGIISPIAFDAPVEVGTIDWLAERALLKSLWNYLRFFLITRKRMNCCHKTFFNLKIFI